MRVDWQAMLAGGERWTLVANLPYNVATPLVCDLLDDVPPIESMLVMVQREVAERFAAPPGNKQYGAVSVKVAYWATARIVGHVPASVFVPRPNVESALVRIDRREPPDGRSGGAVRAGSDGVRAAPQDVAAFARGRRRAGRLRRPPVCRPRRAPSNSRSTTGCDSRTPPERSMNGRVEVQAPAKLTLSLRITGVRRGRPPSHRRRDDHAVTARPRDDRPRGRGRDHDRSLRRGRAVRRPQHRRQGALARRAHAPASRSTSASRTGAGSGVDPATPRQSCDGPVSTTPRRRP